MKKKKRIRMSVEDKAEMVRLYKEELMPMIDIASKYCITRMGVWKILQDADVDTTKKTGAHIATACGWCKIPITKVRCQFRNSENHFCSHKCFSRWLNRKDSTSPFISYRHGLRIARKIVAWYFPLFPGYIVHHEDRDETNNDLANLRVFACQGDHNRYHRGFPVQPIWDGSKIAEIVVLPDTIELRYDAHSIIT